MLYIYTIYNGRIKDVQFQVCSKYIYFYFQIKCNKVVLAAGAWSKMVAEKIGITIPLKVIKHNYLVTDIFPGISMFPNVRYTDGSVYLKVAQ